MLRPKLDQATTHTPNKKREKKAKETNNHRVYMNTFLYASSILAVVCA